MAGPPELRNVDRHWLRAIIFKVLALEKGALIRLKNSLTAPAIERMVAAMAYRAIDEGEPYCAEWLMNRLVGRVPQQVDVNEKRVTVAMTYEEARQVFLNDYATTAPKELPKVEDL